MPKPRKTIQALAMSGSLKTNPGRYAGRFNAPTSSSPLGAPPEDLTPRERAAWDKIVATCPLGVLTAADEGIVELTARLWVQAAAPIATASTRTAFARCLQQLGMTPASRTLVTVAPPPAEENEFAKV